jgi:hypothetical protein
VSNNDASAPLQTANRPKLMEDPLRARGMPDYVEKLNEQLRTGVDPNSNAEAALRKILGPEGIPASIRERYYQLLGVPLPNFTQGDYFQSFGEFAKNIRQTVTTAVPDLDRATSEPWDESQYPQIAEWLAKNEQHLNDASAATELSQMYVPLVYDENVKQGPKLLGMLLPASQQHRELAEALIGRAMLRLGQKRTPEAWADLQACHRLARHVSQGGTLMEATMATALEIRTCEADRQVANHGRLTVDEARSMEADLRNLEPLPSLARYLYKSERYKFSDAARLAAHKGFAALDEYLGQHGQEIEGLERLAMSTVDWDEVLRIGDRFYDKFVEAASGESWAVDSWYRDNGLPPYIVPYRIWWNGWPRITRSLPWSGGDPWQLCPAWSLLNKTCASPWTSGSCRPGSTRFCPIGLIVTESGAMKIRSADMTKLVP